MAWKLESVRCLSFAGGWAMISWHLLEFLISNFWRWLECLVWLGYLRCLNAWGVLLLEMKFGLWLLECTWWQSSGLWLLGTLGFRASQTLYLVRFRGLRFGVVFRLVVCFVVMGKMIPYSHTPKENWKKTKSKKIPKRYQKGSRNKKKKGDVTNKRQNKTVDR